LVTVCPLEVFTKEVYMLEWLVSLTVIELGWLITTGLFICLCMLLTYVICVVVTKLLGE
jgi:hypothetical protein